MFYFHVNVSSCFNFLPGIPLIPRACAPLAGGGDRGPRGAAVLCRWASTPAVRAPAAGPVDLETPSSPVVHLPFLYFFYLVRSHICPTHPICPTMLRCDASISVVFTEHDVPTNNRSNIHPNDKKIFNSKHLHELNAIR